MNRDDVYRGDRDCPVCGCNIKRKIFSVKMAMPSDIGLPEEYNVAECDYCGCCYADTSATAEDYDNYYKVNNFYGEMDIEISTYKRRHEITIKELQRLNIGREKMLDIGFGKGELCVALKENGFENISGIDPALSSVEHLRKQGIACAQGSIYDRAPEAMRGQYKVVFMYGMIEHLYNPVLAVERAKEYLMDDGYMFWSVPLFDRMEEDLTPVVNNFNAEHINYFSEVSLDNIARLNGLQRVAGFPEVLTELGDSKAYGILAVYQVGGEAESIRKDCITAKSIAEYYSRITQNYSINMERVKELRDAGEEIVIWGTGAYMKNLWATAGLDQCNVSCFIDNNMAKVGTQIFDRDVVAPTWLRNGFGGRIVICCMMYAQEILKQIKEIDEELVEKVIIL